MPRPVFSRPFNGRANQPRPPGRHRSPKRREAQATEDLWTRTRRRRSSGSPAMQPHTPHEWPLRRCGESNGRSHHQPHDAAEERGSRGRQRAPSSATAAGRRGTSGGNAGRPRKKSHRRCTASPVTAARRSATSSKVVTAVSGPSAGRIAARWSSRLGRQTRLPAKLLRRLGPLLPAGEGQQLPAAPSLAYQPPKAERRVQLIRTEEGKRLTLAAIRRDHQLNQGQPTARTFRKKKTKSRRSP